MDLMIKLPFVLHVKQNKTDSYPKCQHKWDEGALMGRNVRKLPTRCANLLFVFSVF